MSPLPRPATLAILGLAVLAAPAPATRAAAPGLAQYRFSYRVRHRQQPHGETSTFFHFLSSI